MRESDSAVVCSGCVATYAIAPLPLGQYAAKSQEPSQATAVYRDPNGSPGRMYYLVGARRHARQPRIVASGVLGVHRRLLALTPGAGHYTLYAVSYDGLVSPYAGPVSFAV